MLAFITDNSNNEGIPYQEKPNKYTFSDENIYKGVKISFKSKDLEEQEQQQSQPSFFQSAATQQEKDHSQNTHSPCSTRRRTRLE